MHEHDDSTVDPTPSGSTSDAAHAGPQPFSMPSDTPDEPTLTPDGPPINPVRPKGFDEANLRLFLSHIVDPSAGATEFRILNAQYQNEHKIVSNTQWSTTLSAWYDNIDSIVKDAKKLREVSAYICLNPTSPDLLARSHNRLAKVRHATTDEDIVCLRWFYIDVDPVRPADISATDDELRRAVERRDTILRDHPEIAAVSLVGRSGNGAFIMARLPDYPNDPDHRKLVADSLDSIMAKYSDATIKIDVKTKNPSRVGCVPGTLKCKGSHVPARPWKMAVLEGTPEGYIPGVTEGPPPTLDLRAWLGRNPAPVVVSPVPMRQTPATHHAGFPAPWDDRSHRLKRAAAYADRMPGAVSGSGGHNATFNVACALVKGFDLATHEARPIMEGYNARCNPPWAAHEIEHKLREADELADPKMRGYLFEANREEFQRQPYTGPGADFVIGQVEGTGSHAHAGHAAHNGPHGMPAGHPASHPTPNGQPGGASPLMPLADVVARATVIATQNVDVLYRDKSFLASLAHVESVDPGEGAAIESLVKKSNGFTASAFNKAMKPHRDLIANPPKAKPGQPGGPAMPGAGLPFAIPDGLPEFRPTDMGNAELFSFVHAREARYVKAYGDWMVYDGKRWAEDAENVAAQWAQQVPGLIGAQIRPDMSEETIEAIQAWQTKSESTERLGAVLKVAMAKLTTTPDTFDKDHMLFNCQNGTIDLKTGDFREHRSSDFLTKISPVVYDPEAKCPLWDKFVLTIMKDDEETVAYLRRIMGYAMTGNVTDHAVFICYGGGSNGKALATDTPIVTPEGWTTMGELRVGDTVFDDSGKQCKVTFVTPVMHKHDCYEVKFKDGSEIVADADHIWEVDSVIMGNARATKGKRELSCKTTKEIADTVYCGIRWKTPGHHSEGIAYRHRIKLAGAIETEDADLLIDPYILGAWLGDGNSLSARITCHDDDVELIGHLESCGTAIKKGSYRKDNVRVSSYQLGDGRQLGRYDRTSIGSKLRQLGVKNNKHIPHQYLRGSIDQRLSLMQGLMDTDGTISKAGQCEFAVVNRELANGFYELACSLGFKPTMRVVPAKIGDRYCGNNFRIQFWAYSDTPVFRLGRKVARLKDRPTSPTQGMFRQIVAVNPVSSVPVCCIQVDSPSHLYLAGKSMIPTHNTTFLSTGAHVLGDFATDLDPEVLMSQANAMHPTGLTDLEGRRLVVCEETDDRRGIAEAIIKRITGGGKIRARKIGKDYYEFEPTHHIFMATNHLPSIGNNDHGIWRRLKLIPFEVQFDEKSGRTPDRDLPAKLKAEASGILNWMLAGLRDWQQNGLMDSPAIKKATNAFREESDTLGWYLEENTVDLRANIAVPGSPQKGDPMATSKGLYQNYKAWAEENGVKPMGPKKFGTQLNDRGFTTWKSGNVTYKTGIMTRIEWAAHEGVLPGGPDDDGGGHDGSDGGIDSNPWDSPDRPGSPGAWAEARLPIDGRLAAVGVGRDDEDDSSDAWEAGRE